MCDRRRSRFCCYFCVTCHLSKKNNVKYVHENGNQKIMSKLQLICDSTAQFERRKKISRKHRSNNKKKERIIEPINNLIRFCCKFHIIC